MADKFTPTAADSASDAQIEILVEALKPFALDVAPSFHDDDTWTMYFKAGDIRRAHKVYETAIQRREG